MLGTCSGSRSSRSAKAARVRCFSGCASVFIDCQGSRKVQDIYKHGNLKAYCLQKAFDQAIQSMIFSYSCHSLAADRTPTPGTEKGLQKNAMYRMYMIKRCQKTGFLGRYLLRLLLALAFLQAVSANHQGKSYRSLEAKRTLDEIALNFTITK